jgi:phage terminase Nu1 subunit (DNA packaging protein)
MSEVNRKTFAEIVGKSEKWVGNWIAEGMPTRGGGGKGKPVIIETSEAIAWLIEREVYKQVGNLDDEEKPVPGTKTGEDLLLTQAKRRKADVEADKAEASVISIQDASPFIFEVATVFGTALNGLSSRLTPELVGKDDPAQIKHIISREARAVRITTADRLRNFVAECLGHGGGDGGRATTEERGGMGEI